MASNDDFVSAQARVKTLRSTPAPDELLELYALYKQATAGDVKEQGGPTFAHVKDVAGKVKQRAETTARIAKEVKPTAQEAGEAIRDGVLDGKKEFLHQADTAHEWATRLNRLRVAAGAAARAANEEAPLNGTSGRNGKNLSS
jgi:acyl-CoA-binding protein